MDEETPVTDMKSVREILEDVVRPDLHLRESFARLLEAIDAKHNGRDRTLRAQLSWWGRLKEDIAKTRFRIDGMYLKKKPPAAERLNDQGQTRKNA